MKVILLKELHGRGGEGDVIDVSRGFANNYLLRQGYAIKATPGNLKQLEERRANIEKREVVRLEDANALAGNLEGLEVDVIVQVGEEGQLFGSVTAPMIAEAIEAAGLTIDRRRIELGKPIKTTGKHPVDVGIYRDIKATVTVNVRGDQETVEEEEIDATSPEATDDFVAAEAAADAAGDAVADAIEEAVAEAVEETDE